MRIEFFPEASDGDVLLIYSDDPRAWLGCARASCDCSRGELDVLHVHRLEGVTGVDGCRLTCRIGQRDSGVVRIRDLEFDYELTRTWWDNNEFLIGPFAASAHGEKFQFLWDGLSEITPIVSTFRGW